MSYSVTLSNGNVLSGLQVSGTCFVSKTPVSAEMFSDWNGKLSISGSRDAGQEPCPYEVGEHEHMGLDRVFTVDGEWYFYLTEPSAEELEKLKTQADIEYIAMMTGVEL